jgi:hypothetical protein
VFENAMRFLGAACAVIAAAMALAPAAEAAPARIAFEGDGSIYTMNPDGSNRARRCPA